MLFWFLLHRLARNSLDMMINYGMVGISAVSVAVLFVSLIVAALATLVSVYASLAICGASLRSRSMSLGTSLLIGLRCLGALLLGLVLYLVGAIVVVLVSAVFPGSLETIVGMALYAVLSVGFLAWSLTLVAYATSRDR
jgi:hypothetical protein